jgi:hypothetical protein
MAGKNFTDRNVITELCSVMWAELLYHSMIMANLILLPLDSVPHVVLSLQNVSVLCAYACFQFRTLPQMSGRMMLKRRKRDRLFFQSWENSAPLQPCHLY